MTSQTLERIGSVLSGTVPAGAQVGRLSHGVFGVLLPDCTAQQARTIARAIVAANDSEAELTVGAAACATCRVTPHDLFRVAGAALNAARSKSASVRLLVAGSTTDSAVPPRVHDGHRRLLSNEQLRSLIGQDREAVRRRHATAMIRAGMLAVAGAGVVVILRGLSQSGDGVYDDIFRYGAVPWLAWQLALAASTLRFDAVDGTPYGTFILVNSSLVLAVGVGVAALTQGGITAPITAALLVKALFDSAILHWTRAALSTAILAAGWIAVAMLGPHTSLWITPFYLALFATSLGLGVLSKLAMTQTAAYVEELADIDLLTQLPNQSGFERRGNEAFRHAATRTGEPFAVIVVAAPSIDAYSQCAGYAAGDEQLRHLAHTLQHALPQARALGRIGGASFAAALPYATLAELDQIKARLKEALQRRTELEVVVTHATCPSDGATLPALTRAAQRRAREATRSCRRLA